MRLELVLATLALPAALGAQSLEPHRSFMYAGAAGMYAKPKGEFAQFVNQVWGIDGHFIFGLEPRGIVGMRIDASVGNYGNDSRDVPLSPTLPGITVNLTTTNNLLMLGVGPQLMMPTGTFRPYIAGTVGLANFWTQSTVKGQNNGQDIASSTNMSDATFAWSGRGGVYIPLAVKTNPVSLDLNVRYGDNGRPRYLRKGDIQDNGDGTVTMTPHHTDANLLSFQIGISVGL